MQYENQAKQQINKGRKAGPRLGLIACRDCPLVKVLLEINVENVFGKFIFLLHGETTTISANFLLLGPPQTRVVDHKKLLITKMPVCEASYR